MRGGIGFLLGVAFCVADCTGSGSGGGWEVVAIGITRHR